MERCFLEVCVDSVEGAIAAREGGAHRVELCSALLEGGVTPSEGLLGLAVERAGIPVHVMIRPRGGDFRYSALELEVMERDIRAAARLGAAGVVLGLLEEDGSIDIVHTRALAALARPLSVTFHRAFDMSRDPFEALEALVEIGIDRLLTSGQERTALEGLDVLVDLSRRARGRIAVMPGGGITERSLRKILDATGARDVHVTGRAILESPMRHRNTRCFLGGELRPPEYSRAETDRSRIATFSALLRNTSSRDA
ncbi:MAG TPA: copper homeostasis protein CutC [Planctomycetota bacterium]|nr:copper homeostasis protein CutC [Planctomycetota bacterium]